MPQFKFTCSFTASVGGDFDGTVELEDGIRGSDRIRDAAEEIIRSDIEDALSNAGCSDLDINEINDIEIIDLERTVCKTCNGKGFTLTTIDIGAGLLKASPCTDCQRVPTTTAACELIIDAIDKCFED